MEYNVEVGINRALLMYVEVAISESELVESASDFCIVSEFSDASDNKYLLIVNRQHDKAAEGKITLRNGMQVSAFDKATGSLRSPYRTDEIAVSLPAGDAAAFILCE